MSFKINLKTFDPFIQPVLTLRAESSELRNNTMKSIQCMVGALSLAAVTSLVAQVPFNGNLTALNNSGVAGGFGGTYNPSGGLLSSVSGSVTSTATAVSTVQNQFAVATPTAVTGGTVTGPGGFLALLSVVAGNSTINPVGNVNQSTTPGVFVYVEVKNQSYTFGLVGNPSLPVGQNQVFTVTLNNGATAVASGTFTASVSPVPEPETYAAAAALCLVGFGLWRRRNA